jgi:hypothetical protein
MTVTEKWSVERRIFLEGARTVKLRPNLLAEVAVFLVSEPRP